MSKDIEGLIEYTEGSINSLNGMRIFTAASMIGTAVYVANEIGAGNGIDAFEGFLSTILFSAGYACDRLVAAKSKMIEEILVYKLGHSPLREKENSDKDTS